MLLLTGTSDLIQVVTGQAVTVDVHASWVDNASGTITPGRTNTLITSNQTTTVVASPAASTQRNVQTLNVRNTNATSSCTVTVLHYDGANAAELFEYTLLAGEVMQYVDGEGWKAFTASGRLMVETGAGGTASVTSAELASAVNSLSATDVSIMSAISVESAARAAADTSLDGRIGSVMSAVSVESAARAAADISIMSAVSVESAARAAADISIMSAVSVESAARAAADISIMSAVSVESAARAAADTSLDGRITSGLGRSLGNISGVSIGTLSDTQVLKWDSAAGNWHNATDATGGAGGSVEPTSNAFSVLSAAVAALSVGNSANHTSLMSAISVESLARAGADTSINTRVTSVMSAVSTESAARAAADISIMSAVSVESASRAAADTSLAGRVDSLAGKSLGGISGVSIGTLSDTQVLKWNSAQGQWTNQTDASGGAGASVTSTELSARAPWLNATLYVIADAQVINVSTANTNISGLSFAVGGNQTWRFQGLLLISTSAATVGLKMGASVPPLSAPKWMLVRGQALDDQGSLAVSAVSIPITLVSVVGGGIQAGYELECIINTTSSGVVQFVLAGVASTAASPLTITPGSYIKAFRLK